jgi:hypothetical protein
VLPVDDGPSHPRAKAAILMIAVVLLILVLAIAGAVGG